PRDPEVTRQVARAHADVAQREAADLARRGDYGAANLRTLEVARRIEQYAGDDAALKETAAELRTFAATAASPTASPMVLQAAYRAANRPPRRKRDEREGGADPGSLHSPIGPSPSTRST